VLHYLRHKADSQVFPIPVIAEVDLYKFDPWDLPDKALFGEREWYYFSPRDRKYPNGARPNRAAASGYWKATGTDKPIHMSNGHSKVGVKKALVFYRGKAPKGEKTNWIMHEYRLAEGVARSAPHHRRGSLRLDDWVLCRIYKKCSQAQRATKENDTSSMDEVLASLPEIDDILPHRHPLGGASESTPQQQSLMLPETTSKSGYLMDSLLHKGMMSNNGVVSMQEHLQTASPLTNEWKRMDTTYGNQNQNHRYTMASSQAMASLALRQQTLNTTGLPMAMNHQFQQPTQRSYNEAHIAVEKPGIGACSASNEEVQSALRCSRGFSSSNDGSLEGMFPTMSFENGLAQSTLSYANPAMATSSWFNSSYDCS
jgi:hypothetical protein